MFKKLLLGCALVGAVSQADASQWKKGVVPERPKSASPDGREFKDVNAFKKFMEDSLKAKKNVGSLKVDIAMNDCNPALSNFIKADFFALTNGMKIKIKYPPNCAMTWKTANNPLGLGAFLKGLDAKNGSLKKESKVQIYLYTDQNGKATNNGEILNANRLKAKSVEAGKAKLEGEFEHLKVSFDAF